MGALSCVSRPEVFDTNVMNIATVSNDMRQLRLSQLGLAVFLIIAGCAQESKREIPRVDPPAFMALPPGHLAKCEQVAELRPACPDRVPLIEKSARKRAETFRSGKGSFVFFSEWSAPYPGITRKNAPPRFLHVNVRGGDLDKAYGFQWPTVAANLSSRLPKKRTDAILLDTVTWFGKAGSLVLAPSYPEGGIDGDHLIFRWSRADKDYAISIHAWLPLSDTREALRALIGSTGGR